MPSRRAYLTALSAGLGAALAGCTDGAAPTPSDDGPAGSPATGNQTPTPSGDAPTGPGVAWTAFLGPVPVEAVAATADGVYAVGGTNGRATPDPRRKYMKPESSRNLVAFDTGGERRWRYEAPAGVFDPTPAADGVYATVGWSAGTHGVDQRVVRIEGGEQQWASDRVDRFLELLTTDGDTVFVGTADDQRGLSGESLFSLAADGTERWRVEAGDATSGTVHDGSLYVPFVDRQVVAFDAARGGRRWEASGGPVDYPLRAASGQLYLDSEQQVAEGYPIRAIDTADATEQWTFVASTEGDTNFVATGAVRQGDTVYVTEYDGTLFALDASDGTERWRYRTDGDTRKGPLVVGDTIYLGTNGGGVHAVEADGTERWRRSLDGPTWLLGADAEGVAASVIGKEESQLVGFGPGGSQQWSFTTEGRPNPSTAVGSRVYFGTQSGFLVALDG